MEAQTTEDYDLAFAVHAEATYDPDDPFYGYAGIEMDPWDIPASGPWSLSDEPPF